MDAWSELITVFMRFEDQAQTAWCHHSRTYSYGALSQRAQAIAAEIVRQQPVSESPLAPVLVYGHKSFDFLAAWWACILCGCPIVPVESDNAPERLERIVQTVGARLILNTDALPLFVASAKTIALAALPWRRHEDDVLQSLLEATRRRFDNASAIPLAYIMFSSGTTGEPKGIQISLSNLVDFLAWIRRDFALDGAITGNVRYCFDVSLFEIWLAWQFLQPLSVLDHRDLINTRKVIAQHAQMALTCWVSTPSMVRLYLLDPTFNAQALTHLQRFIFCGETLPKAIVTQLWARFPGCQVINTYGPTECTVAVSRVVITPDMLASPLPLPIGNARPGAALRLADPVDACGRGQLLISGECVGPGYLNAAPARQASFSRQDGQATYATGDIGLFDGIWYYFLGREDGEVKIQGHRIDLHEIEHFLRDRNLVVDVVVEPYWRKGNAEAIQACVILNPGCELSQLGNAMQAHFPPWAIPRYWYSTPRTVLNHNGKLDRSVARQLAMDKGEKYVFIANQTTV
ncbi:MULTISPECIES: AMP-binding protein [unclassified Pseudomonas]|uniref:AMP-binding protein n=1 Tax=unclassified Pseudomonas TaxID=196821 RepID=UPI001199953D|nr:MULTISPECIES: AMP-binding protein [unclassified Pseudomonas]TWC22897.1 D-alanine--poly(phosphoribitol) ligase subunit 1 [Pseudomonas sp. SJZ075]TWC24839.1 D-alanine--poly(phosphoribitol) ligase subunit 1 [Pseudomonas sp. SJZ074]TWC38223.1 D-alanine--poly(phosphoribitol) ligase subunit 1 [Pseudomonas sp. SJZ078]TWC40944.1 D-alanine--poly(phosphoribitol) ligase subunit 1 [Pseudomonas sp. SJZ085]TWC58813.1 D-alanine--poly(phosphoribitol) ligase subunit 1 [Pseudomonas sp. SJZ124]